jgi:hypothetical protein
MTITPTENPEVASGQTLFIGRKQELAKLDAVLQRGGPALVLVTGEPGAGKTTLLQVLQSRAASRGWKSAFSDSEGVLSIMPDVTQDTFSERVRSLLDIPASESFLPGIPPDSRHLLGSDPFVEELRLQAAYAPVLLLIDGYQPAPEFGHWFVDRFIKDVARIEKPVVIVVAERPEAATRLFSLADEIIALGALETQAVRQHLESIGQHIIPKMKPEELNRYVEACQKSPGILGSLTRVLRLAEQGEMR